MALHRRIIFILSFIGIAIVLALLVQRLWPQPSASRPQITAAFNLVDQTGAAVSERDYRGKYMFIYFGFAFCPDVCPFTLDMMSAALAKLPTSVAEKIQPIFISLDPERDTVEELARYMQSFDPRFVALTGSKEAVAAAARQFKVYFQKVEDEASAGGYVIDHSSIIYLMDPQGGLIQHFTHHDTEQTMARKLRELIPE